MERKIEVEKMLWLIKQSDDPKKLSFLEDFLGIHEEKPPDMIRRVLLAADESDYHRVECLFLDERFPCPICNEENAPDQKYCILCGCRLSRFYPKDIKIKCPSCGTENRIQAEICTFCEAPQPDGWTLPNMYFTGKGKTISSVGWKYEDYGSGNLFIGFKNCEIHVYFGVKNKDFDALVDAPDTDECFASVIQPSHPGMRIIPPKRKEQPVMKEAVAAAF